MGSDRARISYDDERQYRAVVMQQGRVTVEADWNEAGQIVNEEIRKEALDVVGLCGTPDGGYQVSGAEDPFDFTISPGTMYVGGMRAFLAAPVKYSKQPDWLDKPPMSKEYAAKHADDGLHEFIYLFLQEQEVSAVEDFALREVALGGPDTAQRVRLIQHIVRLPIKHDTVSCATALEMAKEAWEKEGLTFKDQMARQEDQTLRRDQAMRLMSRGRLQVSFKEERTTPDPCKPEARGGYLGADNQLIRVQVSKYNPRDGDGKLIWGFDNASFLYRVEVIGEKTLKLKSRPVDDAHRPRANQVVEVLLSTAQLNAAAEDYVASATGFITRLDTDYVPETKQVELKDSPKDYLADYTSPVVFLRIWEEEVVFKRGEPILLGQTGLQVTLTLDDENKKVFHVGDYWQIALRPSTQREVYPCRYLDGPQPPDGPRLWACPLAVIEWNDDGTMKTPLEDCRNRFDNLVELTKRNLGGCCTRTIRPEDLHSTTLKTIIDELKSSEQATVCLMPGIYALPEPLRLGPEHSNLTLEGCHEGVIIRAAEGKEVNFLDGLLVLNEVHNVTLRGLSFILPQTPFIEAGGSLANQSRAATEGLLGNRLKDLQASIGVRPLSCQGVTIMDCHFQFTLIAGRSVFGVGIFAGGECNGIRVQRNWFRGNKDFFSLDEDFFSIPDKPPCLAIGFLLSPTNTLGDSGRLVRSLLQDTSFQDNVFDGLSAAALVYAETVMGKFERNTVRNCYTGFWLLSLGTLSLAFGTLEGRVSVNNSQKVDGQSLLNLILAVALDPIIRIGSVLARSYPLPREFDVSSAIQLSEEDLANARDYREEAIKDFFRQALSLFKAAVGDQQALLDILHHNPIDLDRLNLLLSTSELAGFIKMSQQKELQLGFSSHLSDNDIDAMATHPVMNSSFQLVVWDINYKGGGGTMTISANKIINCALPTLPTLHREEAFLGTVLVLGIEHCAVTGNLILQYRYENGLAHSLALFPTRPTDRAKAGVAVTGNVFRSRHGPLLPQRRLPQSPLAGQLNFLESWDFLNTLIE